MDSSQDVDEAEEAEAPRIHKEGMVDTSPIEEEVVSHEGMAMPQFQDRRVLREIYMIPQILPYQMCPQLKQMKKPQQRIKVFVSTCKWSETKHSPGHVLSSNENRTLQ